MTNAGGPLPDSPRWEYHTVIVGLIFLFGLYVVISYWRGQAVFGKTAVVVLLVLAACVKWARFTIKQFSGESDE